MYSTKAVLKACILACTLTSTLAFPAPHRIVDRDINTSINATTTYDYVIVGGGCAGLTLAARLTEDPHTTVLVIEAGGDGIGNINITDLNLFMAAFGTDIDWAFPTLPLKHAGNRTVPNGGVRGKVLGGSTAINGGVYTRGNKAEFDAWETFGSGWNWDSMFAAMKKSEHFFSPPQNISFVAEYHGESGPIDTSYNNPVSSLYVQTVIPGLIESGAPVTEDDSGPSNVGPSPTLRTRTPPNNTRSYAAPGYYWPNQHRTNLHLLLHSEATKIVWQNSTHTATASGVEYLDANGRSQVVNGRTVVLSTGSFVTPKLLELSGVGNPNILEPLGINTVVDLPGVGEHLTDHLMVPVTMSLNQAYEQGESQYAIDFEPATLALNATSSVDIARSLFTQSPSMPSAVFDVYQQLYDADTPWYEVLAVATPADGATSLVLNGVHLRELSLGSVHAASADAAVPPAIDFNFFESEFDGYYLSKIVDYLRGIVETPAFKELGAVIVSPPTNVTGDALVDWVKAEFSTVFHPVGTSIMMRKEDGGVVDNNLKVYGTKNVYIVDASIMPVVPSAHTQAATYGIAERAADLFKGAASAVSKY